MDIGAAHPATLDGYAFEGASKRNKPNLKVCMLRIFSFLTYDYNGPRFLGQLTSLRSCFTCPQRYGPGNRVL